MTSLARTKALIWFFIQLALNFVWTPVFHLRRRIEWLGRFQPEHTEPFVRRLWTCGARRSRSLKNVRETNSDRSA